MLRLAPPGFQRFHQARAIEVNYSDGRLWKWGILPGEASWRVAR